MCHKTGWYGIIAFISCYIYFHQLHFFSSYFSSSLNVWFHFFLLVIIFLLIKRNFNILSLWIKVNNITVSIIICIKWETLQTFTVLTISSHFRVLSDVIWNLDLNYYSYFTLWCFLWRLILRFVLSSDHVNDSFQDVTLGLTSFHCFLPSLFILAPSFSSSLTWSTPRLSELYP